MKEEEEKTCIGTGIAHIVVPRLPELSAVGKQRMKAWGAAYLPLIKVLNPDPDLIPILILSLILILIHLDPPDLLFFS